MAMLEAQQVPTAACTPDIVGNAFVHQYYHILHQSPEHVHRFYQEISKLGRPEENGIMSITSTLQAIDKKILAYGHRVIAEVATVDTQESYGGGVLVLVTGYLTGKDGVRRTFTQTFFLAPQEMGYFVLNDIFRYIDDSATVHGNQIALDNIQVPVNIHQDPPAALDIPDDFVQKHVQENHTVEQSNVLSKSFNGPEVFTPSEDEQVSATEEAPAPEILQESPTGVQQVGESDSRTGEVPKRSYASIVKVMKENAAPISASRTPTKVEPKRQEEKATHVPLPTPLSEKSDSGANAAVVNGNDQDSERAIGPSIYLKGLPLDATPALLEKEFQKFGLIRTNGIQVKSQKGFCFGFVEFESASSMQSAVESSPIMVNGHKVVVEEKRSTSRGNYRGRSTTTLGVNKNNGGYRNEGGRDRGGFRGGRGGGGYGRSDFNGYGSNRGNNRGGGYTNRANVNGGGFRRINGNNGRISGGGGIDANGATKPADVTVAA